MLDVPVKQIRRDLASTQYYDYQPKPIAEFVPEEVAFTIRERQQDFPGVIVRNASVREYPMGRTAAHIVGSVGLVQPAQLEAAKPGEYGPNDAAGQAGLELQYEKWLRGRKGLQRYVVNSDGERIRELGGREPSAGADLVLTMDGEWQRAAEDALYETHPAHPAGLRRGQRHELQGRRRRRGRARRRDRRREGHGLLARLRPPLVRERTHERPGVLLGLRHEVPGRERRGPPVEPCLPGGLPAGLDVQAVHGARGGEGGLRELRHVLPVPLRVHPRHGRVGHHVQQLVQRRPRREDARRAPHHLVRHELLRLGIGLLVSLPARPARREQRAVAEGPSGRGGSRSRPASTCRARRVASCPTRNGATTPTRSTCSARTAGTLVATSSR